MSFAGYIWPQMNSESLQIVIDFSYCIQLLDDLAENNSKDDNSILMMTKNITKDQNHVDGKSGLGKGMKMFVTNFCKVLILLK